MPTDPSHLLNVANHDCGAGIESPACLRQVPFPTWRVSRMAKPSEATKGSMTCNLVELRGHALKNYGVTDRGKQGSATAMTKSDGRDSVFDREVDKFGTAAKSVHFHHLVLMEFDSSRRNRSSLAISFAERPSASNCKISLWRDVSAFAPPFSPLAPLSACSTTSFVKEGVMKVFPFKAAWMATTNSSGAECLTTKPEAPASNARRA